MKNYKRLTKRDNEFGIIALCPSCSRKAICDKQEECVDCITEEQERLAEIEDKIENGTLKEVVRCKDCVYFQPEYVEMENKERRPYTKEEIKNGKIVSLEQGINCGSRCERFGYWDKNSYPVWFNENDFCSYGKSKAEAEQKLKELQNARNE